MKKIPFYSLVQKVESGSITAGEVKQFFLAEIDPDQPFDVLVGINAELVDLSSIPSANLIADGLLEDASRVIERKQYRKTKPTKFKRNGPIVAEGDSWFKLPAIYPDTQIDILKQQYGYSITNVAHWGDTLGQIVLAGEYLPLIGAGRADTLLFSAGGNDLLGGGELWRFLNLFDVDHADPSDAAYYILPEFYDNLDDICAMYRGLIDKIKNDDPKKPNTLSGVMVVGHGYDYAIPRTSGPWLGEPMLRQGLHPTFHAKLCRAIVKIMMDAFNDRLSVLQTSYPSNFTYVNLRNTLTQQSEWFDELHAKTAGAKKFARKMNTALQTLKSSSALPRPITTPIKRRFAA